jgi:hypothetical protein
MKALLFIISSFLESSVVLHIVDSGWASSGDTESENVDRFEVTVSLLVEKSHQ